MGMSDSTPSAPAASAAESTASREVWVFGETLTSGSLTHVAAELLGAASDLAAATGGTVCAVLIGDSLVRGIAEAGAFGASRVYVAESASLARYDDERYAAILAELIRQHRPAILLGGATAIGRALLPRVAVLVHTGLTADCTQLAIDPKTGLLLQTRPAFGGNLMATITCASHRPQMATVRPGVLKAPAPQSGRQAEVIRVPVGDLPSHLRWLEFRPRTRKGVDLRSAEIIVTAGFGCGGPPGVKLVAQLAEALGGVLGASRAVVDAGWVEYPHQVGQTGMTVQPKLYVACGVSGAIQHLVGMQNSETIVAINKDSEAPIFRHADVAVTGDLLEVIPELLRQLAQPRVTADVG